jgi:uncharacterized damage-inducible protein DinB
MTKFAQLEYWLRGPVPGIPPLLQPVAHAILQAREEVNVLIDGFPAEKLWERPAGVAAVGFHLQHLTGVMDRLLTYGRGEALARGQLEYLAREGTPGDEVKELVERFNQQVDKALAQIAATPEGSLTEVREVGRDKIPSTVGGLLFHAAEHTQRHLGQLLVTVRVLGSSGGETPASREAESEDGVDQIRQPL